MKSFHLISFVVCVFTVSFLLEPNRNAVEAQIQERAIEKPSPSQTSPPDTIYLPNLEAPLYGGMDFEKMKKAIPLWYTLYVERLSNGITFCFVDVSYLLFLDLVNGKLVELRVQSIKPESDFARWFSQTVQALPESTTAHETWTKQVLGDSAVIEAWETSHSVWTSVTRPEQASIDFSIRFPTDAQVPLGTAFLPEQAPDTVMLNAIASLHPDIPPQPLHSPQPKYPSTARTSGLNGRVVVKVYVDKDGEIKEWEFMEVKPSGLGFAKAVEETLQEWSFKPAMRNGEPVASWVAIPFNFEHKK